MEGKAVNEISKVLAYVVFALGDYEAVHEFADDVEVIRSAGLDFCKQVGALCEGRQESLAEAGEGLSSRTERVYGDGRVDDRGQSEL